MSCFAALFPFMRRTENINGVSYNVVKRIGEGGKEI